MTTAAHPTRRAPGRPALPVDRILDAAIELVDDEGAQALSMRALAQRLQSGTATLYRHFSSRGELVSSMVDRMLGHIPIDFDAVSDMDWEQACTTIANHMFDALSRHGNVASLLIERPPVGPNALAIREACLAVLLKHGFSPRTAARAYATLARYVLGMAIQLPASPDHSGATDDADVSSTFQHLDAARFPSTVAVAAELPVSLNEEFEFGLQLIVAGLGCADPP